MADPKRLPCDKNGEDNFAQHKGITNGAKWYSVSGGMQDFNYLATNCFEITLELSCQKFPEASKLPTFWDDNKDALLNFMWQTHDGIKGLVTGSEGEPLEGAIIWVTNVTEGRTPQQMREPIHHTVDTTRDGEYWRLLTPGKYEITVQADGYSDQTKEVEVGNPRHSEAKRLDFQLRRQADNNNNFYANGYPEENKGAEMSDEDLQKILDDQYA